MSDTTNQNQSNSDCQAIFVFNKILSCTYYYDYDVTKALSNYKINYEQATELLKIDKLISYMKPDQKITTLTIRIHDHQKELIEHIINNLIVNYIHIIIETNIEINLSQIKSVNYVEIYDYESYLSPEYMHHLIKLLENRQAGAIIFHYNSNISLKEDLAEFEEIVVHIITSYKTVSTYVIQLKDKLTRN